MADEQKQKPEDFFVVEYSPEQQAIHIDRLGLSLEANRELFLDGTFNGYIPLFVCATRREAGDFAAELREKFPNHFDKHSSTLSGEEQDELFTD